MSWTVRFIYARFPLVNSSAAPTDCSKQPAGADHHPSTEEHRAMADHDLSRRQCLDPFALTRADDAELLAMFRQWVSGEREAARYGSENPDDEDGFNALVDA